MLLKKLEETDNTIRYQQQLTDLKRSLVWKRSERDQTERGNTKSFFFMTMLHHILQNRFATCRKHSAGKFYPLRLTHQTWLLPITSCLHRRVIHLLTSVSVRTKMWKNGSMKVSQQRGKIFTGVVFTNCPKNRKMYKKRWSIVWIKNFYDSSQFNASFLEKESTFHTCGKSSCSCWKTKRSTFQHARKFNERSYHFRLLLLNGSHPGSITPRSRTVRRTTHCIPFGDKSDRG